MENTYDCPNCKTEITSDDFLPSSLKCPNCLKMWETEFECDWDNYYCWITNNEIIEE